jgi:hypothetical protein
MNFLFQYFLQLLFYLQGLILLSGFVGRVVTPDIWQDKINIESEAR